MEKQLDHFTEIELKALAYDMLAQTQMAQQNLNAINAEFARRAQLQQQSQILSHPIPRVGNVETV